MLRHSPWVLLNLSSIHEQGAKLYVVCLYCLYQASKSNRLIIWWKLNLKLLSFMDFFFFFCNTYALPINCITEQTGYNFTCIVPLFFGHSNGLCQSSYLKSYGELSKCALTKGTFVCVVTLSSSFPWITFKASLVYSQPASKSSRYHEI